MSKLYVANCTNQVQDFQYRMLENNKVMKQVIAIGEQICVPGDLSTPDVDYIIDQHARYGLVAVAEIDRTKAFIGVCYSLDCKVDMEKVRRAVMHNLDVLTERGKTIRQEAAVAVNNAIEEQSRDFKALEMSIAEIERDGRDTEVNEEIRVSREVERTPPRRSRRASGTRRAA